MSRYTARPKETKFNRAMVLQQTAAQTMITNRRWEMKESRNHERHKGRTTDARGIISCS